MIKGYVNGTLKAHEPTADELAQMPVKSMEVRYIAACTEGEKLSICKKEIDGGLLLGAVKADGKCAAIASILLK